MRKKVAVLTLGCKVNQYESDAIVAGLGSEYDVTENLEFADIYIINTCAVTNEAERKSRQAITKAVKLNPNCKIYVCGCASQNNPAQFKDKPNVVYVSGTADKLALCSLDEIEENKAVELSAPTAYEDTSVAATVRTRHFLKVQDGCNNFCSYCIIPLLRGRSRSRSLLSVLKEIEEVKERTKEIVLTGINLSSYGKDIGLSLKELIKAISKFDIRVRLGSLEVGVVDDELLAALKELPGFCEHFHLSLQSGDDEVLKAMNRRYTTAEYADKVALIRSYFPKAAITTDIIVGFPTETEEQFENTCRFVKEVKFADIHVFSFSKRENTAAAKLQQLDPKTIDERQKKLSAIKWELKKAYNSSFIGVPLKVLFEAKESSGYITGHSGNYITVYALDASPGEIKTVVPSKIFEDGLMA